MELKMTETPKCIHNGAPCCRCMPNGPCTATGPTKKTPVEAFSAALHRAEPDKIYQQLSKSLCGKGNATLEEMLEAAEQVKHRAESEMRPLTRGEVRKKLGSDSINPPYVWIEQKRDEDKWLWIGAAIARLANEKVFGRYNQMWRCWPRKPTPEQMAAEKWEE